MADPLPPSGAEQPTEALSPESIAAAQPARAVPTLPPPDAGRYDVGEEVARGGMGRILRARDRRLDRSVALKELQAPGPDATERFVREALVTARLQHPAVVPIYDLGRSAQGVPFYAMKLVSGRGFDQVMAEAGTLPERLALLPHLVAVAEAVAYAHSQRIVHRDLKPGNVLIGAFGETVVVDWGLAKDVSAAASEPAPGSGEPPPAVGAGDTVAGTVLGTPHFMAPEQARGEPVDERADVYALGAMLYRLLSGAPPHSGHSTPEVLSAVATRPARPLEQRQPDVPAELSAIVRKAMAPAREQRYASAAELAADLRRFLQGQLVSVHRYTPRELLRRWLRRHRAVLSVAAVLSLGLLASLVAGVIGIRREARIAGEERDRARLEAKKAAEINAFVQGMLQSTDPRAEGRAVTVSQVLDEAARRVEQELRSQPEVQAAVRLTLARTYEGLGLLEPAEAQARAALETRRRALGAAHPDTGESLRVLGDMVLDRGDPQAAEALYREALALYRALGKQAEPAAADTLGDLARALGALGQWDEAVSLQREALSALRRVPGHDEGDEAATLNNLAVALGQKGEAAEAEALHREALSLIRKVRGREHPEVAAALSTLAADLVARGDYAAAEPLFQESLDLRLKLLGPDHPDTAWTLYNYAYSLRLKGDVQGALRHARAVLALRGRSLPEAHPLVAGSLLVAGLALMDAGRPGECESPLRESLALRRRNLPPGHWLASASESALGACLARQGRFREAETLLLGSYQALLKSRGPSHERTREALERVVSLYESWGRPAKASEYRRLAGP